MVRQTFERARRIRDANASVVSIGVAIVVVFAPFVALLWDGLGDPSEAVLTLSWWAGTVILSGYGVVHILAGLADTRQFLDDHGTEFVTDAFETEVNKAAVTELAETVTDSVATLCDRVASDDRLETLLRSQPGGAVLTSTDTIENEEPEPLTQRAVIEPLLTEPGYEDLAVEEGDYRCRSDR